MKRSVKIYLGVLFMIVLFIIISGCQTTTDLNLIKRSDTVIGFNGPVTVWVTIRDGLLVNVSAQSLQDDDGIGTLALTNMPRKMVKAGTLKVDVISGATYTSQAIIKAAENAYNEAISDWKNN